MLSGWRVLQRASGFEVLEFGRRGGPRGRKSGKGNNLPDNGGNCVFGERLRYPFEPGPMPGARDLWDVRADHFPPDLVRIGSN